MVRLTHWWMLLLALPALTGSGLACTITIDPLPVGQDFRVRVTGRTGAVRGLELRLFRDQQVAAKSITGRDGTAAFRNVPHGNYTLRVTDGDKEHDWTYVEVKRNVSPMVTVPLTWPQGSLIMARALTGTLRLGNIPLDAAQPPIALTLVEARSGTIAGVAKTGPSGAFSFANAAKGVYYLRLKTSLWDIRGQLAVEIAEDAPSGPMEIDLVWSSCGLAYSDRRSCHQPPLALSQLAGNVHDESGAAISRAEVLLTGASDKVLAGVRTGERGDFTMPLPADGAYRLVIRSPGFSPAHVPVTIQSAGATSQLDVRLGIMGECSVARPR